MAPRLGIALFAILPSVFANTTWAQNLGSSTDSATAPSYSWSGDTTTGIWRPAASTVGISTGGTDRVRVLSSGNVGIGTTVPSRLLQVGGAMKLTPTVNPGTPTPGDIFVDSTASNTLKYHNGSAWVSLTSGGSGDFLRNGTLGMTGNLRLNGNYLSGDGGNEGVFVTSTGLVGVGMTAPTGNFQVDSATGDVDVTFSSSAANASAILNLHSRSASATRFTYLLSDWPGNLKFRSHSGSYQFWNAADTNMFMNILSSGNVGIGTTAPTRLLQVAGAMKITPTTNPGSPTAGDIFVDSSASNTLKYHNGSAWVSVGSGSGDLLNGGNTGAVVVGSNNSTVSLEANNAVAMTVLANGNVGIGTSAPQVKLDVAGRSHFGTGTTNVLGNSNITMLVKSTTNPHLVLEKSNVNISAIAADDANFVFASEIAGFTFRTNIDWATGDYTSTGNERVRITNAGNVGIGTTNPTTRLDVAGTTKLGTAGTAFTSMGACTTASISATAAGVTTACTGVPAASSINCSPSVSIGSFVVSSRVSSAGNVTINASGAATAAVYYCMWMKQ